MLLRFWMTRGCRVGLRGEDPAGFLDLLCQEGVSVSNFRGRAAEWTLETEETSLSALMEAAERTGMAAAVERRRGAGHFLDRFRFRRVLLILMAVLLLLTGWFSTRIWELQVVGNETLTRAEVLSALEQVGVYPGVSGLKIDNPKVRSYLQERLPALSWCTVQVHGSRAVVVVRERRKAPEIVDEKKAGDLIAMKTGVTDFVSILEGKPLIRKGELVLAGQTLASGTLTDRQEDTRLVHALGEVWAQTWYENTMEIPLRMQTARDIGRIRRRIAVKICDFRMNFYFDSGNSEQEYAKIERELRPEILGMSLPLSFVCTELREIETAETQMDAATAETILQARLLRWLDSETENAEQISAEFESTLAGDVLRVTLRAVCREQIAAERAYGDRKTDS